MTENRYKLNVIDNKIQLVQLYIDGFDELETRDKILMYHLYRAALAGRDIAYDQSHPQCLALRNLVEDIIEVSDKTPSVKQKFEKELECIQTYLYYTWIGNGPYDQYTSAKITLSKEVCPKDRLVEIISALGQGFNLQGKKDALELVTSLETLLYDPNDRKILTEKSPGEDWIKESAVNFYDQSLTLEQVKGFVGTDNDKYQLNSTVVKRADGSLDVEVWRAGSSDLGIGPGRYANELTNVIYHLEKAVKYAESAEQQKTIQLLIRYLQTGEAEDFRQYNIHWVGDNSVVDFILGFIEVYTDPMGLRAQYEGSVYWKHQKLTASISKIGDNAHYFEQRMPWDEKYKKKDIKPISLNVVMVVAGVGGMGPGCILGVNLPNEESIREQHGSKSIVLQNNAQASDEGLGESMTAEFCWDQQEIDMEKQYGTFADNLATALHEALGHASGLCVVPDPSACLPGYYSTLEEARADLVALWHIYDPKLVELGIVDSDEIGKTLYRQQIRTVLVQLRKIDGDKLEEDHMKNRQLIANYIIQNSKSVEKRERDGKTYYVIVDYKEAHRQVGILLSEIMRIKAEGDLPAAQKLVDTYALYVDKQLRDQVKHRIKTLGVAAYASLVMPTLIPVTTNGDEIQTINVEYQKDFKKQMFDFKYLSLQK
ncbi:dipeptidyl-peptidase III [Cavenderia fasciculata]|uniref:Dipeptidyl-peptidase III n=1 Tax=Cavenderia fasciculata TaxID=261658 RepID=F4PJ75_CACFS|nr:dipeptidyl-peptidase III [Cavenderia fasciculata]EGG24361.1 dipeptidyl-peptidase III [Cavenderia fasciculata]|eukprot:XP_004362212.1 dipeptidyl-peptidase III [Cavenderia fasciculata]